MNWTQADIDRIRQKRAEAGVKEPFQPQAKAVARGRIKEQKMNKTEAAYARLLEVRKQLGEIIWYRFEPFNIRLAANTYYRVDFGVMLANGEFECHEVKGFWRDDARIKFKVVSELLPFQFVACRLVNGAWEFERI